MTTTRWPQTLACFTFAAMVVLWFWGGPDLFRAMVQFWGIDAHAYPFFDMQGLLSAIECKRMGIDAYLTNPCDPMGRTYDYPPTWSLLTYLPVDSGWINPAGMLLGLAFLASLFLLPASAPGREANLLAAGLLSSTSVFALERGNNDLAVFVLVALAAWWLSRRRSSWAPFVVIQIAGLLKYFPLAAMALALREGPKRFWGIAALSVAATAGFLLLTWPEPLHAITNVPVGSPFRVVFGASNLGKGMVMVGAPAWLGTAVTLLLIVATVILGLRLGQRPAAQAAAAVLSERQSVFFLGGAFMVIGCFFAMQNIEYRAVHALLMLPALAALSTRTDDRRYSGLVWVLLAILWLNFFRIRIIAFGISLGGVWESIINVGPGFLLREMLWWWFALMTTALVTALLKDAPMIGWAKGLVQRG